MEVEFTPNFEEDMKLAFYVALLNGSINAFGETPLHIAALLGHLELCQVLVHINPTLANKVDSEGRCPLHLASAEGHTEVVKALLMTNPDICLIRDKDNNLPLHLAASRGHVATIQELTRTMPCSIHNMTDSGSVLHLCVRGNHMEALKFIVQSVRGAQQLLPAKDKEGNTVLHLAVSLRQIQTIKYLLSLPEMRTAANALNRTGLTALDHVLERCPKDFVGVAIESILIEAGVQSSADIATDMHSQKLATGTESHQPKRWENFWSKYLQYQGNWIEETRGTLMVVATVISTMTFQSALNPPGGVWQGNTKNGGNTCTNYGICKAGAAWGTILAVVGLIQIARLVFWIKKRKKKLQGKVHVLKS
ncbi:PGG domain [Sesbania bispinosa]|nr:PGG domain [Sesbania bispinosa]